MSRAVINGLWNSLGTITTIGVGIFISIFVVRSLNDEALYGQLSYYLWLAGLVTALGILGLPPALTRFTAELRGQGKQGEATALGRWVGIFMLGVNSLIGVGFLIAALRADPAIRTYLLLIALVPSFNALGRAISSSFTGRENYRPAVFATVAASLVQLALILASYLQDWGVYGYFFALISPNIVTTLFLLAAAYRARDSWERHVALTWQTVRRFASYSLPVTLQLVLDSIIWQRSEVFFLERFNTIEAVGFYSLVYTLVAMFIALGWSLVNGYFPAISYDYGAGNWEQIRSKINQALVLSASFTVPLTFGGLVTLPELIRLLYGENWLVVVPAGRILFLSLLPAVAAGVFGLTIGAVNRPWALIPLTIAVTALNLVLDFLLIPNGGAVGAAIANTAAQASFALLAFWIIWRLTRAVPDWRTLGGIVAISAVTTLLLPLAVLQLFSGLLGLVIAIPLAGATYAIGVLLMSPFLPSLEPVAKRFLPTRFTLPSSR